MKSELIVDVKPSEVSIALLEDGRLVSLQKEARDIAYAVGDIYLAKVKKLMPGLNAAFVNVGYDKDAFLHYLDLGPHFASYAEYLKQLFGGDRRRNIAIEKMKLLPDIDKNGTIAGTLTQGQELLVQIVKEPISSKGPRLTTEITFTGRYLVLTPFCDRISISQKIKSTHEKLRLRQLVESIKPKNFGVIVRTSAEGKGAAELINELQTLVGCWDSTVAKAQKSEAPALVYEEESRILNVLRDIFSPSFESIQVNDPDVFAQIEKYVSLISPERKDIVKLYDRDEPIFDHFAITRQIKSSFGKTVSFRSGAYIIIESTEALHVIDVNSGNRSKAANDQESNALEVNLRAADEIARQLRLRDMGGIIVVDFIDMSKGEHRQQLYEHMRQIMSTDRARHNILPLSKFGLMQITRQRVRPALDIAVVEKCPSCFGKGEVQPSLLFTDTLFEKLDYLVNHLEVRNFIMYVHPFVDAYIKRGIFTSLYGKWRRKLGRVFKVLPDESLAYLQYRILDAERNEIDLQDEKDLDASSAAKTTNKAKNRGESAEAETAVEAASQPAKPARQPKPKQPKPAPKPAAAEPAKPAEKPAEKAAAQTDEKAVEKPAAPAPEKRKRKPKRPAGEKPEVPDEISAIIDVPDQPAPAAEPATEPADATDAEAAEAKPAKPKRSRSRRRKTDKAAAPAAAAADEVAAKLEAPLPPALPPHSSRSESTED